MRYVGVVECKATWLAHESPAEGHSCFSHLLGASPSSRVVRPTRLRTRDEKRVRNNRVRVTVGALYASYSQSRCCNRLKRDDKAVCTHRVVQRMTAETSLMSGICTQGHDGEDCANGEISRMGLNGRVWRATQR